MRGYLERLLRTSAAYQVADVASRVIALVTLPLYTSLVPEADYGLAETIVTLVVLASIPLRLGLGEAFVRWWHDQPDEAARHALTRRCLGTVAALSTLVAGGLAAFASGPLSELVLGVDEPALMAFGLLGLWAFSNLELAKAVLRVEERVRAFFVSTVLNVALTAALTITLVVGFDLDAEGLVAGNFVASALTLVGLWIHLRGRIGLVPRLDGLAPLLRFGAPTIPADAAVFALNVVDRLYLLRVESAAAAGLYAVSTKLAGAVIVLTRGFQNAWPPLAYSVRDDAQARRLYGVVTTYYVMASGLIVAGLTLLGRWVADVLAAYDRDEVFAALPWIALGWALLGLYAVLTVIAQRAHATVRQLPAALLGLAVNVAALPLLVGPYGTAGAGVALCLGYAAMLATLFLLVRRLPAVGFEWRRLAAVVAILAGGAVAGELLLPTDGLFAFLVRGTLFAALGLVLLAVTRADERAGARQLLSRARSARWARRTASGASSGTK